MSFIRFHNQKGRDKSGAHKNAGKKAMHYRRNRIRFSMENILYQIEMPIASHSKCTDAHHSPAKNKPGK